MGEVDPERRAVLASVLDVSGAVTLLRKSDRAWGLPPCCRVRVVGPDASLPSPRLGACKNLVLRAPGTRLGAGRRTSIRALAGTGSIEQVDVLVLLGGAARDGYLRSSNRAT